MTADEYRARVKAMGLTPCRPSYDGATIHQDRSGQFTSVPDPEQLTASERADILELIRDRGGYSLDN